MQKRGGLSLKLRKEMAREYLAEERLRFEEGDQLAWIRALRQCAWADLPLPRWLSKHCISACDKIISRHVASLDDAFGRPFPKGIHLDKQKRRLVLAWDIFTWIDKARTKKPKPPLDDDLFECAGRKFRIGKTLAKDLYYAVKRLQDSPLPTSIEREIAILNQR
jgi:hypothetical protein